MTAIINGNTSESFYLVKGQSYYRTRGENSMRDNPSDFYVKSSWQKSIGKYGKKWALKVKENEKINPSIKEVVKGIYEFHKMEIEDNCKNLKESNPQKFNTYRDQMRKTFKYL